MCLKLQLAKTSELFNVASAMCNALLQLILVNAPSLDVSLCELNRFIIDTNFKCVLVGNFFYLFSNLLPSQLKFLKCQVGKHNFLWFNIKFLKQSIASLLELFVKAPSNYRCICINFHCSKDTKFVSSCQLKKYIYTVKNHKVQLCSVFF